MSTDLRAALDRGEVRRAITNAYYDARNEGETMEVAADRAADAVMALATTPEPAPALDFEEFRKEISDAIDRDGQHDWDEAARLADIIAAKVWNGLVGGAYALPAPLAKEPSDD